MPDLNALAEQLGVDPDSVQAALAATGFEDPASLREKFEKENAKRNKELADARDELAKVSAEKRSATLSATLSDLGGQPVWAEMYPADADVSPDKVKEWAEAKKLPMGTPPVQAPATPASTMQPMPAMAPPAGQHMSMTDWEAFNRQNPAAAIEKLAKGEVDLPRSPYEIYTDPFVPRGG